MESKVLESVTISLERYEGLTNEIERLKQSAKEREEFIKKTATTKEAFAFRYGERMVYLFGNEEFAKETSDFLAENAKEIQNLKNKISDLETALENRKTVNRLKMNGL